MKTTAFLVLFAFFWMPTAYAQNSAESLPKPAFSSRSNYTKFEYRIPMRDGVKLYTAVYAPKDNTRPYPILLNCTPYSVGMYGAGRIPSKLGPSDSFVREGFIFAYQDVRGRGQSGGQFINVPPHKMHLDGPTDTDPTTDAYDTIDWLVKNVTNNNGRVGLWGVSYNGYFAALGLINSHPALKAVSPQAPMADEANGDDVAHNGAFFLAANFRFFNHFSPRGPNPDKPLSSPGVQFGTEDSYDFYLRMGPLSNAEDLYFNHRNPFWTEAVQHPNYDEFWASRAFSQYMHHLTASVLLVGGWFDAEDLGGTVKMYRAIDADGSAPALTLVMGPWPHGGWQRSGETLGYLSFESATGEYFREQIQFPFFMQALKGVPGPALPKAWMFETGSNQWRQFDAWPPKNAAHRSLYLDANGKLSFSPSTSASEHFDEYTSDPTKPVPVTGEIGEGMPADFMTRDQRFASRRTDVLAYQTEVLKQDVIIAGPVTPVLRVSSSGTDSDFDVKLIDVYPNDYRDPDPNPRAVHFGGYQQLVRGEPFRAKFRDSMAHPQPLRPGKPAKIEFVMPDVLHDFRAGHRIMVQIQSSWFPMVDRNPQRFEDIPTAKAADFQKAVERVYYGGASGTRIDVLVLE